MFYLLRVIKPYGYSNATVWNKTATPIGRNLTNTRVAQSKNILFCLNGYLTSGWSAMACPHWEPVPGRTLITPGGIPAFRDSSANFSAVNGDT